MPICEFARCVAVVWSVTKFWPEGNSLRSDKMPHSRKAQKIHPKRNDKPVASENINFTKFWQKYDTMFMIWVFSFRSKYWNHMYFCVEIFLQLHAHLYLCRIPFEMSLFKRWLRWRLQLSIVFLCISFSSVSLNSTFHMSLKMMMIAAACSQFSKRMFSLRFCLLCWLHL